jgi:hypothetical protein
MRNAVRKGVCNEQPCNGLLVAINRTIATAFTRVSSLPSILSFILVVCTSSAHAMVTFDPHATPEQTAQREREVRETRETQARQAEEERLRAEAQQRADQKAEAQRLEEEEQKRQANATASRAKIDDDEDNAPPGPRRVTAGELSLAGLFVVAIALLVGWMIYSARSYHLKKQTLATVGFSQAPTEQDEARVEKIVELLEAKNTQGAPVVAAEPKEKHIGETALNTKKIGELLANVCNLKPQEIEASAAAAREFGERLGRYLLRCGMVTPEQLCRALALQSGLPTVDLSTKTISPALGKIFSFPLLREYNCVPFNETRAGLSIAIGEPLTRDAVDDLESRCGKSIKLFIGQEDMILKALDELYVGSKERKHPRFKIELPVEYRFTTRLGRPIDDNNHQCTTLDISEGGLSISQPEPPPKIVKDQPRHDIYARVVMSAPGEKIFSVCRLRWIKQPHTPHSKRMIWRLGMQIIQIDQSDEENLKTLCDNLAKTQEPEPTTPPAPAEPALSESATLPVEAQIEEPQPVQPEALAPEFADPEALEPKAAEPEPTAPEPKKPEPAKPAPTHAKPVAPKPTHAKSAHPKPALPKPAAKPAPPKPAAAKPALPKLAPAKPAAAKPVHAKPAAAHAKSSVPKHHPE